MSNEFSYCTNCQAPLSKEAASQQRRLGPPPEAKWLSSPLDTKRKSKYNIPSGTRQAALVGAVVGLVHGIFGAIYFVILFPAFKGVLGELVTQEFGARGLNTPPTFWNILMAVVVVGVPLFGAIIGAALGVLFVSFKKWLPGSSIIRKSMFFSIVLIGVSVLSSFRYYLDPRLSVILSKLHSLQLVSTVIVAIEYPILGYLFGYLLNRRLKAK